MSVSSKDIYKNNQTNNITNTSNVATSIVNNAGIIKYNDDRDSYGLLKVDDNNFSKSVRETELGNGTAQKGGIDLEPTSYIAKSIYHGAGIFRETEIDTTDKTYRFGIRNPYAALSNCREYLFFTKPDLHILQQGVNGNGDELNFVGPQSVTNSLNSSLASEPFWADLYKSRKDTTLKLLQASRADANGYQDPFNHLLQNQCKSNLDIPGLTSEMIDTPSNSFGVNYSYRGSSESSDDGPEFSLEFRDNRYLDTFYFFKAYDEYEVLKHHGEITPQKYYITNKILHDAFSIYKFIVADDMETIIYWGKMYGVVPKSLPRDVFSNPTFDDGLSYSVDFKAAFYEDMRPEIIADFNFLSKDLYNAQKYQINVYNQVLGRVDMRPAKAAAVIVDTASEAARRSPAGYLYKLKWRGSDIS